jgi:hypothetical protein
MRELADLQLAITAIEQVIRDKQDPSFVRSLDSQAPVKGRARMPREVAFDEPVVRTVEQAAQMVAPARAVRLSTLLVRERAVDGSEVAEACEAFRAWACDELPSAPRAH